MYILGISKPKSENQEDGKKRVGFRPRGGKFNRKY
jgi:hypothetical protein